jgi:hypothetical protein
VGLLTSYPATPPIRPLNPEDPSSKQQNTPFWTTRLQLQTTATMAAVDVQAVHDTLVDVAFEAGRMIMAANPSSISTDTKMNGTFLFLSPFSPPFPSPSHLTLYPLPPPLWTPPPAPGPGGGGGGAGRFCR